ncbi:MAG: hypothetical protein AYP45_10925 [Candidatus Brocadia carolinensis]|uniref:Outer membrane protein beta-barrel domain-containing protein n=1 Tax=Candidatus Brocadia carolinensis TaxID=1004156 RepID=A0A1V4ASJ8_9BACT|nr:MAG: hypothetical protein AYP45_10925 [Candidatus Brocadia caroliniensis]
MSTIREVFLSTALYWTYLCPGIKKLHLVSEYSGEKVENTVLDHQLLGGVVWEGPLNIDYDIAGFTGLNNESVAWGITMGITFFYRQEEMR